ncbi:unnamed protein product [Adineta steineri]|uniref:Uncharacterized protein n=1 Tax=Adineta steineri TaxID=433720 RepID=A0A813U755_9BILA|nr:unnamed protein product [Adineta steineri]CAF0838348.1 unnamed protein product [Adineta steineri]CAF3727628.1 unnamed protein product [Adineta steineri]CAF3948123.1 unnamed protein product [Adineta steineri]
MADVSVFPNSIYLPAIQNLPVGLICLAVSLARADTSVPFTVDILFVFGIILFILSFIAFFTLIFNVPMSLRRTREIVIDIGPSVSPVHSNPIDYYSNKDVAVLEMSFEREDVDDLPPYPDSDTRFCSQCSLPRRDSTAKFCSSCGQSFNEY